MFRSIAMNKGKLKNNKGFTILELVVVVSIIAILAGFLYQKFSGREQGSKVAGTQYMMMRYYEAAKSYVSNHGAADFTNATSANLSSDGLINTAQVNPWGNAYNCGPAAPATGFKVWTQVDTAATAQAIADKFTSQGYTAVVATTTVTATF